MQSLPYYQERPYHDDSTASRLLSEVKHRRARLVLRWGTTLESRVLFFLLFCRRLIFRHSYCESHVRLHERMREILPRWPTRKIQAHHMTAHRSSPLILLVLFDPRLSHCLLNEPFVSTCQYHANPYLYPNRCLELLLSASCSLCATHVWPPIFYLLFDDGCREQKGPVLSHVVIR